MKYTNIMDNLGNSFIYIDACTLEAITKTRKKAIDCLMDNFSMFYNILSSHDIIADRIYFSSVNNETTIHFNAPILISYIFDYYGLPAYDKKNPNEWKDILDKKIMNMQNVNSIHELKSLSDKITNKFMNNLLGKYRLNDYDFYKSIISYSNGNYELTHEEEKIINNELSSFREKEILRMQYLSIEMDLNFDDLFKVPSHYLSGISEFDLMLIISHKLLEIVNRYNYDNIYNYINKFIKDNIDKYIIDYKLDTVINKDNKEVPYTYSFKELVRRFEEFYDVEINKLKIKAHNISELPKIKERLDELIEDGKIEKCDYQIFSDIDTKLFESDFDKIKKGIRSTLPKDYSESEITKFEEKVSVYGSLKTRIDRICIGTETFDGYFGFVLKNGVVVLDKFFKNKKEDSLSFGDAAYIITLNDFEKVSSMSKKETIKYMYDGLIDGGRIYHTEDWDKIVYDIANLESVDNIHQYIEECKENYKKERVINKS